MKCQYCGAEVKNRLGYCIQCGRQQAAEEMKPEPEQRLPEPELPAADSCFPEPAEEVLPPVQEESFPAFEDPAEDIDADLGYCPDVPALMLPDKRGLGKMVFLGILTLGIYPVVIWSRMVTELNIVASRHDGKRTMPYFAMLLLTPLTLGVFGFVWMHKFCGRIRGELARRGIRCRFGPRDFWLWNVLGMLILVGPFVFVHKLTKAMNRLNTDFNSYG